MIINGPPYYQYELLRRPSGRQEKFGFGSQLAFLSARVLRGGPRRLAHVMTCFAVLVIVLKLLPHRLTDVNYSVWSWQLAADGDEMRASVVDTDSSVPGGLRIVVFGGNDVATPARFAKDLGSRSWTELLCEELHCTSYLSFVPTVDDPSGVASSTDLYAASLERTLNQTSEEYGPGLDYNFMLDTYPIRWSVPDLSKQVAEFLSQKKPKHSPAETLWVLSFGMWDIWSLASEPLDVSRTIIDALVSHIFEEVERLYASAMKETSIAWSDSKLLHEEATRKLRQTALSAALPRETDVSVTERGLGDEKASANRDVATETEAAFDDTQHFRILIPQLFDPSLTPGWQSARPDAPSVHSKAEQMRNAAALTGIWNDRVYSIMAAWIRTPDVQETEHENLEPVPVDAAEITTNPEITANPEMTGKEAIDAFVEELTASSAKTMPRQAAKAGAATGGQNHLSRPTKAQSDGLGDEVEPHGSQNTAALDSESDIATSPARPQRDGILYDLSNYLQDIIVDRQLRNSGLRDSRGAGTKPTEEGFLEVWKPCVQNASDEIVPDESSGVQEETEKGDEAETEDIPRQRKRSTSSSATYAIRGRAPTSLVDSGPQEPESTGLRICEAPHEHLFFMPFTVSPRAVADIARQAAGMVRRNETMRARWAKINLPVLEYVGG